MLFGPFVSAPWRLKAYVSKGESVRKWCLPERFWRLVVLLFCRMGKGTLARVPIWDRFFFLFLVC